MPEPSSRRHVVVVGASLAGLRAAEGLRAHGHDGPVTIIGEEPHRPYDRPPLSKQILTGKAAPEDIALPADEALGFEWVLGARAAGLDLDRRRVLLADGSDVGYDAVVIATGATPRVLPTLPPGPGIHYLRTLDDSVALRDDLQAGGPVAVIGAGFIGLEVASSAMQMGLPAVVIEALPVPLERALGPAMGRAVMEWHLAKGTDLRTGVSVESPVGADRAEALQLNDGSVVEAATVVVGIGVAPATGWLEASGLDVDNGVLCDERLRVLQQGRPRPDVVAAGDVARWFHPGYGSPVRVEHWTNAIESGEAAACTVVLGDEAAPYAPVPYFWSDQHGVKLQFVGHTTGAEETAVVEGGFDQDRVVVAYGHEGRLVGALGMRRPARIMALQKLIGEGVAFPPAI